jgi:hypothetical protein
MSNVPGGKPVMVPPGAQVQLAHPWAPQLPSWRRPLVPAGILSPAMLPGMQAQRPGAMALAPRDGAASAPATSPEMPGSGGTGPFGTPAQIQATQPTGPRDPLADFWASFNYGGSAV